MSTNQELVPYALSECPPAPGAVIVIVVVVSVVVVVIQTQRVP